MKKLPLLIVLFSLILTSIVSAQTNTKQHNRFETTYKNSKETIESKDYSFVAEIFFDGKTRTKVDPDFKTIDINALNVLGELKVSNSKNESLVLNGNIENYKVAYNDETQRISITFSVVNAAQNAVVTIDVKPNSNAFLTVKQSNSSVTSYIGKLEKR